MVCFVEGTIDDLTDKSNPEYTYLPSLHKGGGVEQAGRFMKEYFIWRAKNLSTKEKITNTEVQDEIYLLLRKFPVNRDG
jgi:hypothetical protein